MLQRTKNTIKAIRMVSVYGGTIHSVTKPRKMSDRLLKKLWDRYAPVRTDSRGRLYYRKASGAYFTRAAKRNARSTASAYALIVARDSRQLQQMSAMLFIN